MLSSQAFLLVVPSVFGPFAATWQRVSVSGSECLASKARLVPAVQVPVACLRRICESNDVPPYLVPPYCPFGIGQGYCGAPSGESER